MGHLYHGELLVITSGYRDGFQVAVGAVHSARGASWDLSGHWDEDLGTAETVDSEK